MAIATLVIALAALVIACAALAWVVFAWLKISALGGACLVQFRKLKGLPVTASDGRDIFGPFIQKSP